MYPNSDLIATHEVIKAMETSLGFSMAVFNDQPTVTLLVDEVGRVLDANRKAVEFFAEERASLLGQKITSKFRDEQRKILSDHFMMVCEDMLSFSVDDGDMHYYWQVMRIRNTLIAAPIYVVKGTDTSKLHEAHNAMDKMQREREAIEREMQKAQIIQSTLLPHEKFPDPFDMRASYLTASEASGDWYGFYHDVQHNMLNIYIGDVTGHGIASSLLTGAVFGSMYSTERLFSNNYEALQGSQESRLLTLAGTANDIIFKTSSNLAMSMFLISIDLVSGKVYTLNAGHRLPFVYKKSLDKVVLFNGGGEVLGVSQEPEHTVVERELEPGDLLFLYTDGIVENEGPDHKRIRTKQLKELIHKNNHDVQQLQDETLKLLETTWESLRGEDDVAIMIIKYRDACA